MTSESSQDIRETFYFKAESELENVYIQISDKKGGKMRNVHSL